jgi:hypothetical protein
MTQAQAQAHALVREFWVNWQGAVLRSLLARDTQALEVVVRRSLQGMKTWLLGWQTECDQRAQPTASASALPRTSDQRHRQKRNQIKELQQSLDL